MQPQGCNSLRVRLRRTRVGAYRVPQAHIVKRRKNGGRVDVAGIGGAILHFIFVILGVGMPQNFPPPLSHKEEQALFIRMKQEGDLEARGRLITHNLRLVSHIVRKYYASFPCPDELISIGSLGLIKAVDTFNAENGARFATYGAKCIQNEILMYFRAQKKLQQEVSMNETIDVDRDGNPLTYMDIISSDDTIAETLDLKVHTEHIITLLREKLTPRERKIVILRYGLGEREPMTQREVAVLLKISRSYVSRIEKKALEKLKIAFGRKPDFSDL